MSLIYLLHSVLIVKILSARPSSSLHFSIEPVDHIVAVGSSLLLNCQAQHSGSGTVLISWKNNDVWLVDDPTNQPWSQLANHSLYYSSIPAKSIGNFTCGATLTGSTSQIIYSRTANVQAAYIKSQYYTHPANATKRLGEVANFDCVTGESLPYASVHWEKDGKYFGAGDSLHIPSTKSTSSAISVKNLTFASAGWYSCVAINPLLPNQPQRSKRGYLTVLPALDKPHFGIHPKNMIVAEHLAAVLECQILGVPPPVISWTFNGQPIQNTFGRFILSNGSLYFAAPVNRSYAGQYVCSGTNSVSSVSSGAILFRVAYFDFSFMENPRNLTTVVGNAVSLSCVPPTSFPIQVTIHWYHHYQQIVSGDGISIDSSGTIKFTSIRKSDEGMYFCDGTNSIVGVTRTSLQAYVTVHVPPAFQVKPEDTNVTVGQPLILHCQATGFPQPTVAWHKDGHSVDTSHVTLLSNGSLYISSSVVQDTGRFSCRATNIVGSLTVMANIVIYVPPSIISAASNATKAVGEFARFQCLFSGTPIPDIKWFYSCGESTVQLTHTAHHAISGSNLEIRQIVKQDEGKYICQAENIAGRVNASAHLRVKVPASLDLKPVNVTVNESSSASFQCNASGDPKPVVMWFKGGQELSAGGRVVIGDNSLTILNTDASDVGQYSCNVSNGLSSHVGVAHLIVQVVPNITLFDLPQLVKSGINVTLICMAIGIPQPRIIWQRNGGMLSRAFHVRSSIHVISYVDDADSGLYTCVASNAAGISSKHGNITVQVVPSSPIPISAFPQSSTVIQLSWKPGFHGHSAITGYKVEIKRESEAFMVLKYNFSVTAYRVDSLDPYTTYTFRISARNAIGLSPGATVTNKTLQDAPSPPRNLVAVPLNSTVIRITWEAPAVPNGLITNYEIQYSAVGSGDVISTVLSANQLLDLKALIDSLKPFTKYRIKIRAATQEGNIIWGNLSLTAVTTTTEAAPTVAPEGIQLQALSAHSILVKWKLVPPKLANGIVKGYVIFVRATGPYSFSDVKNISTGASLNFTIQGLFAWTKYNVSVQAVTIQPGPRSPWKQVRTLEAVPGPPSNVTLVSESQQSVLVFVTPPAPAQRNGVIVGYNVLYRETNLLPDAGFLSVNTTNSSTRLVNLTVYTEYSVKVAAYTREGQGQTSQLKAILTQEGIPGTINEVTATALDHDTVAVTWSAPVFPYGRIVQYRITYNTSDGKTSSSLVPGNKLKMAIHNLIPNTTYYISVTAKTSKGFGRQGTIASVRTNILPPPITHPSEPQTSPTVESTSATVTIPEGKERSTGVEEEQMIIIIVCVGLIVLSITATAVYFRGIKKCREEKAMAYTRARNEHDFTNQALEMERPRLNVHEEPSVAESIASTDSFDSDWNSSVASPYSTSSQLNPTHGPTDLTYSTTLPLTVNVHSQKVSVDSQGSHYDPSYSSVEELGGGFSSFRPLPPEQFRSTPTEERVAGLDKQEKRSDSVTSQGSRKSFTNQLFKTVHGSKDVDLGERGTSCEGFQEKDVSGIENRGYDSGDELNEQLANDFAEAGTSDDTKVVPITAPKNLDDLYAKVDVTKKKRNRQKDDVSVDSESLHPTSPGQLNHSNAKPDKSKKTFRKTPHESHAGESLHDPVVVYDERTNFDSEPRTKGSSPSADKHDARSVGESTLSTGTFVSDLNSSEGTFPVQSENLFKLNGESSAAPDEESPPSSPYILRNKKLSVGSADSFYDEPYSNLEEINAAVTPVPDISPPSPQMLESIAYGADPEEEPRIHDAIPKTASTTSFPNTPYGVMDKPEDEAVIMEVKDIETDNIIQDFDEVLNSLRVNESPVDPSDNSSSFVRSDSIDSTVLMF